VCSRPPTTCDTTAGVQRLGQLARLTACLAVAVVAAAPVPAPAPRCRRPASRSMSSPQPAPANGRGRAAAIRAARGRQRVRRRQQPRCSGPAGQGRGQGDRRPGVTRAQAAGARLAGDARPGATRYRLQLRKGPTITASGGLEQAPPQLQPLVALLGRLAAFHHPSLQPYEPASYALLARVGTLTGGCRAWTLPVPPSDALAGGRALAAEAARGWPTGATAARSAAPTRPTSSRCARCCPARSRSRLPSGDRAPPQTGGETERSERAEGSQQGHRRVAAGGEDERASDRP